MRYRIWCEALPAAELARPSVRALLVRHRLEPLIALPPAAETGVMRDALAALERDGIRWGLWPLLDDAAGYWLSTANAAEFCARVDRALLFAPARPATLAIDLEPPLELTRALTVTPSKRRVLAAVVAALGPRGARRRAEARHHVDALSARLRARGIETLAAILPPVLLDLDARRRPIQAVLSTPLDPPSCDVVCPMLYTSMMAPLLPAGGIEGARAILAWSAERLVARRGAARASIGLGVVGTGKLGNEPTYGTPGALREDVRRATRAGARDLALFSLEGALGREGGPDRWLAALTSVAD